MTTALIPADLAARINAEHDACCRATGQAIDHAMHCGDLLTEAKAGCEHGQWRSWLSDNFTGSQRTAQVYMRLAANREAIQAKAQGSAHLSVDGAIRMLATPRLIEKERPLIEQGDDLPTIDPNLVPPAECTLLFIREFSDGGQLLVIEPSVHPGYYFVTRLISEDDDHRESFVEGTKRPIHERYLRLTIDNLKSQPIVERGERREVPLTEPKSFNGWMFTSYEQYRQCELTDWARRAEEAA